MSIKFITFCPCHRHDQAHGQYLITATMALNEWLIENPNVEIISWQATPVGDHNELHITIQYKELD